MVENFTYAENKETPTPKKLSVIICKIVQLFVASLLLLDVINEWPNELFVYVKQVNNYVHCK